MRCVCEKYVIFHIVEPFRTVVNFMSVNYEFFVNIVLVVRETYRSVVI